MRHTVALGLLAGSATFPPAIVRGASASVFVGSNQYQLGAPFDVRVDFDGRDPIGDANVAAIVRDFVANYPDKRDFWEIANRSLARRLRAVFPAGTAYSVAFTLEPDAVYPARRVSRVDVDAAGSATEGFSFELAVPLRDRLHGIRVASQYQPGCPPCAIPDYRFVQQELLLFGAVHDLALPSERRLVAAFLLARFPALFRISVSLDREDAPWAGVEQRQPGVGKLEADGGCRLQPRSPGEELVFAPAEYCDGIVLPGRANRRYVTPPMATGAGGAAYEAELRSVAAGLAAGIVLPEEFSGRARRHGLVASERMVVAWRGEFVTNGFARKGPAVPSACGVPPGWFPTYRTADLPGIGLPGTPLAAIVPAWLAGRLAGLDGDIERKPETLELRLDLFRRLAR